MTIDNNEYNLDDFTDEARLLFAHLTYTTNTLQEMHNQMALLNKAKNAYISDMKAEIVQSRTGVDFNDLFSE